MISGLRPTFAKGYGRAQQGFGRQASRDDGGANRPSNFLLELGKDLVETVGNTNPTEPVYDDSEEEKPKNTFKTRAKFIRPSQTVWRS